MTLKFQKPKNIPAEIPLHHVVLPDIDSNLILKITAEKSNRVAIIPTKRETVATLIPNFFEPMFGKNSKFAENDLKDDEIFPISIPNLKYPQNVAKFIRNLQVDEPIWQVGSLDGPDFYWIATFFQVDKMISDLIAHAKARDPRLLGAITFHMQNPDQFAKDLNKLEATNVEVNNEKSKKIIEGIVRSTTGHANAYANDKVDFNEMAAFARNFKDKMNVSLHLRCGNSMIPFDVDKDLKCSWSTCKNKNGNEEQISAIHFA